MHPILFEWGPLRLHSYGVLLAFGCAAGIWRASVNSRRAKLTSSQVQDAGILLVLCGLVGARLTYVALNHADFAADPLAIAAVWDGGLTFYGGLAAGILAGYIYTLRTRTRPGLFADLVAPSLALGYSIARVGCFLNGCCYGCPSTAPWAVRFRADGGPDITVPSHPVQIYSSAANLLIFLVLIGLEKRRLAPGSLFGIWLLLSGIERFVMEIFRRGVTAEVIWNGFTQAQAVSGLLVISGFTVIALSYRQEARHAGTL